MHAARIPALTAQSAVAASVRANIRKKAESAPLWLSWLIRSGWVSSKPSMQEKRRWHDGTVGLNIREIEANKDENLVVLNKVVGADGQVTGYRTVYFRNADGIRASPDIVVVNVKTGEVRAVEIKTGAAGLSKNQKIVFKEIAKGTEGNAVPTRLLKDLVDQYNAANPEVPIPDDFYTKMGAVEVRYLAGILD